MWLSKREDKEVLALLDAENAYSAARTAHLAPFREALYREHLSHIQETDETAPAPRADGYEYFSKTVEGKAYRLYCRRARGGAGEATVMLDVNELAEAYPDHCDVASVDASPSGRLLAYAVDGTGYETYSARFVDLALSGPRRG